MGGIFVILFYLLYWWFCWFLADAFVSEKDRYAETKKKKRFWVLAAAPLYVFIYEYTHYGIACLNSDTFYPVNKIENPGVFIFEQSSSAKIHSEYYSGFTIAPSNYDGWKVNTGEPVKKKHVSIRDLNFYWKGNKVMDLSEREKLELFNSANYGVFVTNEDVTYSIGKSSKFIYDFENNRKISNIDSVIRSLSQENLVASYLLPFKFQSCRSTKGKKELLMSTFKF